VSGTRRFAEQLSTIQSAAVRPDTPNPYDYLRPIAGFVRSTSQSLFSVTHDPTELNRQGRMGHSVSIRIFVANDLQKRTAQAYIDQINQAKSLQAYDCDPGQPLKAFYKAEAYHQDYLVHHPTQPYIVTTSAEGG